MPAIEITTKNVLQGMTRHDTTRSGTTTAIILIAILLMLVMIKLLLLEIKSEMRSLCTDLHFHNNISRYCRTIIFVTSYCSYEKITDATKVER